MLTWVLDPTFSYYQWQNRANPGWAGDMRGLNSARLADAAARPPRTLLLQNTAIQNINNNSATVNNIQNVQNMTALAPLAKVDHVKLQPVTSVQQGEAKKTASQFRDLSVQRSKQETLVGSNTQPATPSGESPKAVKLPLPTRLAPVSPVEGAKAPPSRPVAPKPEARPVAKPVASANEQPPEATAHPAVNAEARPAPAPQPVPRPAAAPAPTPRPEAKPAARPAPERPPAPKAAASDPKAPPKKHQF